MESLTYSKMEESKVELVSTVAEAVFLYRYSWPILFSSCWTDLSVSSDTSELIRGSGRAQFSRFPRNSGDS
jgi:hypothetical protein